MDTPIFEILQCPICHWVPQVKTNVAMRFEEGLMGQVMVMNHLLSHITLQTADIARKSVR